MYNRVRELLKLIHYDLHDLSDKTMVVQDKDLEKPLLDVMDLPGKIMSDDQMRKIECHMNEHQEWIQVRGSNVLDSNTHFFRASSMIDDQGNNYYSYEFEKNGSLFDVFVGKDNTKEQCHFRRMDVIGNKPLVVDVFFQDGRMIISKSYNQLIEQAELKSISDKKGEITFSKNGKQLETIEVEGNLDSYYSSLLSAVSDTVYTGNEVLQNLNSNLLSVIQRDFSLLTQLLNYLEQSYEADLMDSYFNKYNLFINPDSIYSVK